MRCWFVRFRPGLASVLFAVACASQQFDGSVYRSDELHFRVGLVPSSWRRVDADSALLAFRDDQSSSTIAVNGRCGVDGDDVPLSALTQHLFLEFTDRSMASQSSVSLNGRQALRSELTASLDGVRKHYVVYVLKKDGCVYDFMLITGSNAAANSGSDFERFVQGFATLE